MAKITVWGDFKVDEPQNLRIADDLQSLLNGSDVNVVNFEAPVKSSGKAIRKSGPNIFQSPDAPHWIQDHGFNVASLANNHIMDFGHHGLEETKKRFDKTFIIGAGSWSEAYKMKIITTSDGLRIGIVAATHREFGTLTDKIDGEGAAWCMHPDFERLILMRKENNVDFLVGINHGGIEYLNYPLPEWRETYKKWIDLGADIVLASHPHVPQGQEYYKGKLICYSLGNFCFQNPKSVKPYWNDSLCCVVDVDPNCKGQYSASMIKIKYDVSNHYISRNSDPVMEDHLRTINEALTDESRYLEEVNKFVLKSLSKYKGSLARSGFISLASPVDLAKGMVECFKKEHAYNTINCESHRWLFSRALKLKYGIF
ncbi:MAG: CapA family protein [Prevotella sp.]|nr:CapA family protein [Prevotella sp.]